MVLHLVGNRRAVIVGVVASLTVLLGGAAVVHLRAENSWASMQATVRQLRATCEARSYRREPLWGSATGDGAFVHYERADAAARQLDRVHHAALVQLLLHTAAPFAAAAGELRAAWQPVLGHLRAGAHATDVRPASKPDAAPKEQMVNLLDARWVANAAIFEARALRDEGRSIEAVQVSLDAATYAADLMRDSVLINQMIGAAMLAIATGEAWRDDAALRTLTPEALALLAAGLARLDASLPEAIDLTSELLLCARALQDVGGREEWLPSAWRYGFSTRWMIADGFAGYAALVDGFADARAAAWPQRSAMFDRATDGALGSSNPITPLVIPNLSAAERSVRETIVRLRILRMAIDVHRGNDALPLRDPLGDGPLLVTHEDGGVRICSAGSTEQRRLERFVAR